MDFEPDTMTGYSAALGMEILGRIIEIVAGEDLNSFLQNHLMKPLGIDCLTFCLTEEQKAKVARLYEYQEGQPLLDVTETAPEWKRVNPANGFYSGAAGMYGTLKSYDRFAQMLANYGELDGVRVLQEATVKMIREDRSSHHKYFMPGSRWGQGMVVFGPPKETGRPVSEGTIGWSGAYGTHFFVDHVAGISAVLMTQRSNIGGANSYVSLEAERTIYQDIQ